MSFSEMLECGVPENTLWKAKSRNSASWSFIDDPDDKRRVLIEYERLAKSYKEKVKDRFGDPYQYVIRQPIINMVKWDHQAEAYYLDYKYNTNKTLPIEYVQKYTRSASWLNMLKEATEDKKKLKQTFGISLDQFYTAVLEVIKNSKNTKEEIDLHTSYRRLLQQRKDYEAEGYKCLIDWRFGNQNSAKIKDELSEAMLLEMIAHHNQYDDVFICMQYNQWAQNNGYKLIVPATVGNHRRNSEHLIIMQREGNAALNEKYTKEVKGFRPSAPLYMIESDDNHLDLYFIDLEDETQGKYYHKYKAIVVIDSFNDYVLGYAYSESLTIGLVRAAYINAMYHIRSLTGAWYLPHEVKTDRWAKKELYPFYKSMGKFVEPAFANKHRGYIEPFFGSPHWKRCLKVGANNYSGNNITAKNRGVNQEVLNLNKKNYPVLGKESENQVEQFFYRLRHMPQSNGKSKHQEWIEAWNKTLNKIQISDEQFLLKFGIEHNYRGEGIRITNRGIEPQINGVQYSYNLAAYDLEHIGKSVSIMYDPNDMSRVLLTDFEKIRLMAYDARLQARSLEDGNINSRSYLNAILTEKKETVEKVAAASNRRKEVLHANTVDAESLLQAGIMVKEIKQFAEQKFLTDSVNKKSSDEFDIYNQM